MSRWILGAGAIYALDLLCRAFKSRITTATLYPLPDFGLTRVEIRHLNAGWRAGQHVRLRVLSLGMGWLGWVEAHPFTIASVHGDHNGLVLLCRKTGDWTSSMYEMAKAAEYGDEEGGGGGRKEVRRRVWVTVEGPYGARF